MIRLEDGRRRPAALDRESSVKSALYWDVAKVKGYGVRTKTSDDGTQQWVGLSRQRRFAANLTRAGLIWANGASTPFGKTG